MSTNGGFASTPLPECAYAPRMTRAAALALRTAGTLNENCIVVITDGPAIGPAATVTEIELHPTSPTAFGLGAKVKTSYDNTAWEGLYDIDLGTGTIIQLQDNLGNVAKDVDTTAAAQTVVAFPWGNINFRDNYVEDTVMTAWNAAVGLFTNNRVVGATVDMTGKTAGAITDTEIVGGTVTTGPNFISTNSRIYGSTIAVNSAATGSTSIISSVINTASITRNAGAAAGTLNITQSNITNGSAVTQNGPGPIALFFTDALNAGTISNLVATTRGISITSCKLTRHTVRQERTNGVTSDSFTGVIIEGGTLILTGAAGLAAAVTVNDCLIQGNSVVTITDPAIANVFQNCVVAQQATLNLTAGGSMVICRIANGVVNSGAFAHQGTVIELIGTTTLTAANINRLRNKGFSDVI